MAILRATDRCQHKCSKTCQKVIEYSVENRKYDIEIEDIKTEGEAKRIDEAMQQAVKHAERLSKKVYHKLNALEQAAVMELRKAYQGSLKLADIQEIWNVVHND